MPKSELQIQYQNPLRWPEGWARTLIRDRVKQNSWKKDMEYYRDQIAIELGRLGVTAATITHNSVNQERQDPGVALWFTLKPTEEVSWQEALGLDTPLPTTEQINKAFQNVARKHHPDMIAQGSGGDVAMFQRLQKHRQAALDWVSGKTNMDSCIPVDQFDEVRLNLAGIRLALHSIRQLDRVGVPSILERVMSNSFKAMLPNAG